MPRSGDPAPLPRAVPPPNESMAAPALSRSSIFHSSRSPLARMRTECKIEDLLKAGAAIDSFGVGTALGSGAGSPERGIEGGALGAVYKEVWHVDETGNEYPKVKVAGAKSTWPGKKEVYRHPNWTEDIVQLAQEPRPDHYHRLLRPVMRNGEMIPGSLPPLSEIRELAQQNLRMLPERYRAFTVEQPYPVRFSDGLQELQRQAAQLVGKSIS